MADQQAPMSPLTRSITTATAHSTGEARKRKANRQGVDEESIRDEAPTKARFPHMRSGGEKLAFAGDEDPSLSLPPTVPFMPQEDFDLKVGADTTEMFENMKQVENRFRKYDADMRFLKYRRVIVDWMAEAGEHFRLHASTVHVAIMYMDRIHQAIVVARHQIQLVGMACLIIAAKYEEAEQAVPPAEDLNAFAGHPYSKDDIYNTEAYLLSVLDWNLTEIVPLHFMGYFMARAVLFEDDTVDGRRLVPKVPRYLMKYHIFFAELCMQEYDYQQYAPSLVAAAIVAASRRALKIRPVWRDEICAVTGYAKAEVWDCYEALWKYYEETFPEAAANAQLSPANVTHAATAGANQ